MRRLFSSWKQERRSSWSPRTNLGIANYRGARPTGSEYSRPRGLGGEGRGPGGASRRGAGPGAAGRGGAASTSLRAGPDTDQGLHTAEQGWGSWRRTETQPSSGLETYWPPRLCAPRVQPSPPAGLCLDPAQGPGDGRLFPPTTGEERSGVWVWPSWACRLPRTFCDKCTGRAAWLSCPPEAAPPGRSHTHPRL